MDGEIGEDMLTEILVRLPYKSLARFQCVSKAWRRLISGDYLRRRLPLITSGVLYHESTGPGRRSKQAYTYACAASGDRAGVEEADMGFFPGHETSTIIDGCNGLLLYYDASPSSPAGTFHVVNPITRRWARLPPPRRPTLLSVLAFDPSDSPNYTVVCFAGWLPRGASVDVFDSGSGHGAWRGHELDFGLDTDAMSATMHYSDGAIHVLAYSGHVVRIDLAAMSCSVTALPAPVSCRARAGHCRGRLRYASSDGSRLRLWELVDAATSGWALRHELGVRDLVSGDGDGDGEGVTFLFMAFHPEREVVYLWTPWKLVAFDVERRRVEEEWAVGTGEEKEKDGAHLIQIWLFPFSRHLANCLA
uniref:F-box domain-containing protein n=1 Tax=Leersia perrieri TaxID=77586 RepID=A0A0D9V8H4_9ORYZ